MEIRDRQSRQLVTAVELLSPTNKRPGPDREQYLRKRRQYVQARVHLVEIDLLRNGPRLPLEDLPECDYYVLVGRSGEYPRVAVWPLRLRDSLPTIPIPLHPPDGDVDARLAGGAAPGLRRRGLSSLHLRGHSKTASIRSGPTLGCGTDLQRRDRFPLSNPRRGATAGKQSRLTSWGVAS